MLHVNGKELDREGSVRLLAQTFYPEDNTDGDDEDHCQTRSLADRAVNLTHDVHEQEFTATELRLAVADFNPKKAPGADGLTADICAEIIHQDTNLHLALLNKCWELNHFPKPWKEATVVMLRKPGKDTYTHPKSYRPIGLLPVMGKILEKMLVKRLAWHFIPRMSPRQYGFTPQRSTEDALYDLMTHVKSKLLEKKLITMVSLDIEGAFDSAWWPAIKVRMMEEKCPDKLRKTMASYLNDRTVRVRYAGLEHLQSTSMGCVQGSIGGPILWNLLLDPLLKDLTGRGEYCQAFADDVVLVFSGDTAEEIQRRGNPILEHVRKWGVRNKLRFAPHKTMAMVLTNKLKYDVPRLTMGGEWIALSKEIKILGLTIDSGLTFGAHVANVCGKALGVYKQLSRAARVSWGLHPEVVRTIYNVAVEPIITYAASVWAAETRKKYVQKHLNTVQRLFAQRLVRAYRTVSLNAALVLAGVLPLDIRVRENASLYEIRRGLRRPVPGGEVEAPLTYIERPHPAEHMDHGFIEIDAEEEIEDKVNSAVQLYTDGSKINGKVGAAISVWEGATETKSLKYNLPMYCTVYQAEILAICEAVKVLVRGGYSSGAILSDSRAALETLVNNNATNRLAAEARTCIRKAVREGKRIELFWVKAHAGIPGNERADQLAKDAALKLKKKPFYDCCPVSFAKREIREGALGEWDKRYTDGVSANVTRMFLPTIKDAYPIVKKLDTNNILTQILTGHGGFSEYLHRFGCKESPSCTCDPEVGESVLHLILDCPIHMRDRYSTEQTLDTEITYQNVRIIMSDKSKRSKFLEFCTKVAQTVITRNKM